MAVGTQLQLELTAEQAAREFPALPASSGDNVNVGVSLDRVGPKQRDQIRTLNFSVSANGSSVKHQVSVKDYDGAFVFDGPMADAADAAQLGAPMLGVVEQLNVSPGQTVAEGDVIATVSAMKMEVHVKAPFAGQVAAHEVAVGDKVVEGALLSVLKQVRAYAQLPAYARWSFL